MAKRAKAKIHIKKSHEGELRSETKTKKGQKVSESKEEALKEHGTPKQKKQAVFALNARHWNHSK